MGPAEEMAVTTAALIAASRKIGKSQQVEDRIVEASNRLVKWPDERLKAVCAEVPEGENMLDLARLMMDVMVINRGMGLAAPQVGESVRLIVGIVNGTRFSLINPRITKAPALYTSMEEGCLSCPGVKLKVRRFKQVTVVGFGLNWKPVKFKARGILATVLQHEIDHLDGVTLSNPRPQ